MMLYAAAAGSGGSLLFYIVFAFVYLLCTLEAYLFYYILHYVLKVRTTT